MTINTNQGSDTFNTSTGQLVQSNGSATTNVLSAAGGNIVLFAYTTGNTQTKLGYDPTGRAQDTVTPTARFNIPSNTAYYCSGLLVCHKASTFSDAGSGPVAFLLEFLVCRGAAANTTILIDSLPTVSKKFGAGNSGIGVSDITVGTDTATGDCNVFVTGNSGETWYWTCNLRYARTGQ